MSCAGYVHPKTSLVPPIIPVVTAGKVMYITMLAKVLINTPHFYFSYNVRFTMFFEIYTIMYLALNNQMFTLAIIMYM